MKSDSSRNENHERSQEILPESETASAVLVQPDQSANGRTPTMSPRRWTAAMVAMVLGFIVASIISQNGAWLFFENDLFLIDHLSERSFISKVICPHVIDAQMYQARELSHVLEYIDAHFIYLCVLMKAPHFYSLMNYVLLFLISICFWRNARKYLRMDSALVFLLLVVFWTTPCIFFSGIYTRVAKQGASLFLFLLVWFILKATAVIKADQFTAAEAPAAQSSRNAVNWLLAFFLSLALCWMDRQGFFLVAGIALTLLLSWLGPRLPCRSVLLTALMAALVTHSIYGYLVGPHLIERYTGFKVSFSYQKLPWAELFQNLFSYLWKGITIFLNPFRYFFANVPMGMAAFILGGIVWLFMKAQPAEGSRLASIRNRFGGWVIVLWMALIIAMNVLMVLRHDALMWPDLRAYYWWIPITVISLIAVTFAVYLIIKRHLIPIYMLRIILASVAIGNLSMLSEHNWFVSQGHLRGYMRGGRYLFTAIRDIYEQPEGTVETRKYNTGASSYYDKYEQVLKDPLKHPGMTPEEFVDSSNFYNWLRSQRHLDFRQP